MNLNEVMAAFNYQVTSSSDYQWNCWPDCKFMDFESEHADIGIVFNVITLEVYEATVCIKNEQTVGPFRWLNPAFMEALKEESNDRQLDSDIAWDDVKWVDLDLEEDFFEKAVAMFNGEEFDERIQMPIDIDDETFNLLAREAHRRDITFNQLCMEAVQDLMNKVNSGEITKKDLVFSDERVTPDEAFNWMMNDHRLD